MDYEKKFSEFLKRMNKNKIDWEKKVGKIRLRILLINHFS